MKKDKPPESGIITVFVEGMQHIPGWVALSRKKQDALLEHTSHIQQFRQLQNFGKFGENVHLINVQLLLDGEDVNMLQYLPMLYPNDHKRTIRRKAYDLAAIAATVPTAYLEEMTQISKDALVKFNNIPNAALGDIRNALQRMPPLPVSTPKGGGIQFLTLLDGEIAKERKERFQKGRTEPSEEMIENAALNALLGFDKDLGLTTSKQRRQFLQRLVGWYMQATAVYGTIRCGKITIPESFRLGPGRPRMTDEEKEKARLERLKEKRKEAA